MKQFLQQAPCLLIPRHSLAALVQQVQQRTAPHLAFGSFTGDGSQQL